MMNHKFIKGILTAGLLTSPILGADEVAELESPVNDVIVHEEQAYNPDELRAEPVFLFANNDAPITFSHVLLTQASEEDLRANALSGYLEECLKSLFPSDDSQNSPYFDMQFVIPSWLLSPQQLDCNLYNEILVEGKAEALEDFLKRTAGFEQKLTQKLDVLTQSLSEVSLANQELSAAKEEQLVAHQGAVEQYEFQISGLKTELDQVSVVNQELSAAKEEQLVAHQGAVEQYEFQISQLTAKNETLISHIRGALDINLGFLNNLGGEEPILTLIPSGQLDKLDAKVKASEAKVENYKSFLAKTAEDINSFDA